MYKRQLHALGKLWVAGCTVHWKSLYKNERRQRVRLPTYPFERERFWIDPVHRAVEIMGAPKLKSTPTPKGAEVDSALYQPTWRHTEQLQAVPLREQHSWLLLIDDPPLCMNIARGLRQQGQAVTTVRIGTEFAHDHLDDYTIDPGSADSYSRVIEELKRGGKTPRRIVHLWNIGADSESCLLYTSRCV